MIFERIELVNLFSYHGHQLIELGTPEPGRNVCMILGRNGFGKTSLLNSLKLLFAGASHEPLRRSVQRSRIATPRQYVTGIDNDWWGIINRRAKIEGAGECLIRLTWTESVGRITAERRWPLEHGVWTQQELLEVETPQGRLTDEDAQAFLDQRLPLDYVYFFFFDGEQIQELAEANRDVQQNQIERILGIGAIDALREALTKAIRKWRGDGMNANANPDLARHEGEADAIRAELTDLEQQRAVLEQEIENDKDSLRRVQRRIEGVSAYVHRHNEEQLREQQKQIADEYAQAREEFVQTFPRDIALLLNPNLVRRACERLDAVLSSDSTARSRVLDGLLRILPQQLFDEPDFPEPDIRAGQRAFYKYKLTNLLEQGLHKPSAIVDPIFAPTPQDAADARDQLAPYLMADALRSARSQSLARLQQLCTKGRQLENDLLNVGALSADERARYDRYVAERDLLDRRIDETSLKLGSLYAEVRDGERRLAGVEKSIEKLLKTIQTNRVTADKIRVAEQLANLFGAVKERRKQEQRGAISDAVNRHFQALVSSHRLIDRIELDEDFGLRYFSRDARPIGMGSLSAGMKQLVAMALVWALSEVSGKRVPVVIDTPLARIDADHQTAILTQYYPNAAEQVIVLPTDSELDERKLKLVAPYVYRCFRLENPDGEHTIVRPVQINDMLAEA